VRVACLGLRNRANGSNTVNEHSSRSHSVLTLNLDSEIYDEEDEKLCMTRHGKLAFVDLAGQKLMTLTGELSWQRLRRSAVRRGYACARQNLNGSRDLTTPLTIHRLAIATDNLPTKFEVSISTHYKDMKDDTKCRKWGGLG